MIQIEYVPVRDLYAVVLPTASPAMSFDATYMESLCAWIRRYDETMAFATVESASMPQRLLLRPVSTTVPVEVERMKECCKESILKAASARAADVLTLFRDTTIGVHGGFGSVCDDGGSVLLTIRELPMEMVKALTNTNN